MIHVTKLPSKPAAVALVLVSIVMVGIIDHITGFDVSLSVFYALPVIFAVWSLGCGAGGVAAFLAVATWFSADEFSGHHFSGRWIPFWNAAVRFCFFLLVVTGAHYTRKQLAQNQDRAEALERALPICPCCKKIRDDSGSWLDLESYVMDRLSEQPAQKICPDCARKIYLDKIAPQEPSTKA